MTILYADDENYIKIYSEKIFLNGSIVMDWH